MLALTIVALVGFVLITFLALQERGDLYKEIDSLKEELIQSGLDLAKAERDIKTLHAIAIRKDREIAKKAEVLSRFAGQARVKK
tara:strand:+ start:1435 stop:1686 length:252 start_codon:yes stop_codon:yes gene_type:complete